MAQAHREAIPPGTLEVLILATLRREGELHGFGIADAIERASAEVLQVEEGSLYPALKRIESRGWVHGEWRRTHENRRARYFRLTLAGQAQLTRALGSWRRVSGAIEKVLSGLDQGRAGRAGGG